jgi:hypothetical protein
MQYACEDVIDKILTPKAQTNSEFPMIIWDDKGCQGKRYPEEGEYDAWSQYLEPAWTGLDRIKSLFVPHHATLELWSANDSYYSVQGPSYVADTPSKLAFWRHWDDTPCYPGEIDCGKRVIWDMVDDDVGDPSTNDGKIKRIRITRHTSWLDLLNQKASAGKPLTVGNKTYEIDGDAFYKEYCAGGSKRFGCQCHDAYQDLLANHPEASEHSFVNIASDKCNPAVHYVPTGARVSKGTHEECEEMFRAQIKAGTFPSLDVGGPQTFHCGGKTYTNSLSDGSPSRLHQLDDKEDDKIEANEMVSATETPEYAYYVIAAILILGFLLIVAYYLEKSKGLSKMIRQRMISAKQINK